MVIIAVPPKSQKYHKINEARIEASKQKRHHFSMFSIGLKANLHRHLIGPQQRQSFPSELVCANHRLYIVK